MKIKKSYVFLLDGALLVLGLAAGWLTGWMLSAIPDCPVMQFGFLCPACGGTRCVRYFFSGQFAQAFTMNPFVFVLIWYLCAALVLLNIGVLLKLPKAEKIAIRMTDWRAVIVAAVLFAVFGIVRNLW
jgi:hypothetical protein